jgi:hypothetical protein
LNIGRWSATGTSDGINVYVFGSEKDTVEQYDATADKWTLLELTLPMLERLFFFAVASVNSYIYVLGGSKNPFTYESALCLKPDKRRYVTKASLPVACSDQCVVSADVSNEALFKVLQPLL